MEPQSGACPLATERNVPEIACRRSAFWVPAKLVYPARRGIHYKDIAGFEMREVGLYFQAHGLLSFAIPNEAAMPQTLIRA
jgi:hypothetical protein